MFRSQSALNYSHMQRHYSTYRKLGACTPLQDCISDYNNVRFHICKSLVKVKVKCTLVKALRICTGRTARRGSRGIALLFHDHGIRRVWGVSVTPRPLFAPGKNPVPIVQEAGWAPGPVRTSAENLVPLTGIRFPDRPARSQSLYRLRYPAHSNLWCMLTISTNNHHTKFQWSMQFPSVKRYTVPSISTLKHTTQSVYLILSVKQHCARLKHGEKKYTFWNIKRMSMS
jgi:hypothetical protein